ncbi:MAG TPA: ROK family protein [Longimicrobiales bacterium]|nr:ROK family protein [Longimicrobiales bacterium]
MSRWVVGLDIGGTNVRVGLVPSQGGRPVALAHRSTPALGGQDVVVGELAAVVEEVIETGLGAAGDPDGEVLGLGIGSPGPLDLERGIVLDAFNLGWKDFPLRDALGEAVGLPVILDNDANCATWGEYWQGAGRGARSLVGVTLGTGIGGGVILQGTLVHGASASAGEVGHMSIDFHGRRCKCGNYGCLEAYASGPNIAARAREGLEAGAESVLTSLVEGDLTRLTAATVYEAILEGDAYAGEVMLETAKILGAGVANIVNVLNPHVVVIVGGVTRAGHYLFNPLRAEVRRRAFKSAEQACRIVPGELPQTAGVIGAAGLFLVARGPA